MSNFKVILVVGLAAVAVIIILGFGIYFLCPETKSHKENMRLLEACRPKPYVSRRMTELHKTDVQITPPRKANSGGGESVSTHSGHSDATTTASPSDSDNYSDYSPSDSTSGGSDSCSSGE